MDSELSAVTRDETITLRETEWLSMRNRIARLVEKADASNVDFVADQLLNENLVAGRGLFCHAVIRSQSKSPQSSDLYAALVAKINSKFPQIGHLLVKRAALRFRSARDKQRRQAASIFLAQLVNRRVAYEALALDVVMLLLLGNPSSDNVEIAASFCRRCGALLLDVAPIKLKETVGEFGRLLRNGAVEKRAKILVVRLLKEYKFEFRESVRVMNEFGDSDDEDRVTHHVSLLQDIDSESSLDRFPANDGFGEEDEVSSKSALD